MAANAAPEGIRSAVEAAVAERTFKGKRLYPPVLGALGAGHPLGTTVESLSVMLRDEALLRDVITGLIRWAFLIELVNEDCTSTKFATRWSDRLESSDPRRADFEECFSMFQQLLNSLLREATTVEVRETLRLFCDHSLVPYELPVDYVERGDSDTNHRIHVAANVRWYWEEDFRQLLRFRAYLDGHRSDTAIDALYRLLRGKVGVKTYLTDRALTGGYKTNREKRWEAHPNSPQFAFRRDCLRVEHALLQQATRFGAFPAAVRSELVRLGLVPPSAEVYRCPVTLDPLSFPDLIAEVSSAVHGKSKFQVGHLNPLKSAGGGELFGHTPRNIGWISDDGNRIQGHLTLAETRALLERVAHNYEELHPQIT